MTFQDRQFKTATAILIGVANRPWPLIVGYAPHPSEAAASQDVGGHPKNAEPESKAVTLFEYLAVLISIVLSFGIIRLLDGLPSAFVQGRRYAIHVSWIIVVLWIHVQFWWVFWSYSVDVAWNYPRFLVVLAAPLLLYSVAITLVPRDSSAVQSWREHFYHVRVRLFSLLACWMLSAV